MSRSSAGSLGSRFAYWLDDGVFVDSIDDPPGQDSWVHTKPDNAWGRVEVLTSGKLYVKGGRFELAALVMPASVDHVRTISEQGERMPAKSTYFYPKLLSGLVVHLLE